MIKIEDELIKDQKHIYELLCCDCYFDLCFYLLRRKVIFDEMNNRFSNLSNCYYSVVFNAMIVSCYKMLRFVISSKKDKLYERNCFETFPKQNTRLCVLCANDLFFILGRMNEFSLRDCC